jgi:uncharacterized membrane protein YidH (DUF202 family)
MSADKGPADHSQQHLANERTFLSWLRTSIALIGLGFIVARFGLFLREFGLVIKNANNSTQFFWTLSILIDRHRYYNFRNCINTLSVKKLSNDSLLHRQRVLYSKQL